MNRIESLSRCSANLIFLHFNQWFQNIIPIKTDFRIITVKVQAMYSNRIFFAFYNIRSNQTQVHFLRIVVRRQISRSDFAKSGKVFDIKWTNFLHHHFCLTSIHTPLFGFGNHKLQSKTQRISNAYILINTLYFYISTHFTSFDGNGIR